MKAWQAQLGTWGSFLWIVSFQVGAFAAAHGYEKIAEVAFGYVMGFITVLAGHLLWDQRSRDAIVNELFESKLVARYLLLFSIIIILSFALWQMYWAIFKSFSWNYNVSAVIGGFVVNQGVKPIIEHLEGR